MRGEGKKGRGHWQPGRRLSETLEAMLQHYTRLNTRHGKKVQTWKLTIIVPARVMLVGNVLGGVLRVTRSTFNNAKSIVYSYLLHT